MFPSPYGEEVSGRRTSRPRRRQKVRCFRPLTGKRYPVDFGYGLLTEKNGGFRPLTGKRYPVVFFYYVSPSRSWFPSPYGEEVSGSLRRHNRTAALHWFPSPYGEEVSGSQYLAQLTSYENRFRPLTGKRYPVVFPVPTGLGLLVLEFPSPYGEEVSGRSALAFGLSPRNRFPSPYGEEVSGSFSTGSTTALSLVSVPLRGRGIR